MKESKIERYVMKYKEKENVVRIITADVEPTIKTVYATGIAHVADWTTCVVIDRDTNTEQVFNNDFYHKDQQEIIDFLLSKQRNYLLSLLKRNGFSVDYFDNKYKMLGFKKIDIREKVSDWIETLNSKKLSMFIDKLTNLNQ